MATPIVPAYYGSSSSTTAAANSNSEASTAPPNSNFDASATSRPYHPTPPSSPGCYLLPRDGEIPEDSDEDTASEDDVGDDGIGTAYIGYSNADRLWSLLQWVLWSVWRLVLWCIRALFEGICKLCAWLWNLRNSFSTPTICSAVVGLLALYLIYVACSAIGFAYGAARPTTTLYDICNSRFGIQTSIAWRNVRNGQQRGDGGQRQTLDFCADVRANFHASDMNDMNNLDHVNELAKVHPALVDNSESVRRGQASIHQIRERFQPMFQGTRLVPRAFINASGLQDALDTTDNLYADAYDQAVVVSSIIVSFIDDNNSMMDSLLQELNKCEEGPLWAFLDWAFWPWAEYTFLSLTLKDVANWEAGMKSGTEAIYGKVSRLIEVLTKQQSALQELKMIVDQENKRLDEELKWSTWDLFASVLQRFLTFEFAVESRERRSNLQELANLLRCCLASLQQHLQMMENLQESYRNTRFEFSAMLEQPAMMRGGQSIDRKVAMPRERVKSSKRKLKRFMVSKKEMDRIQKEKESVTIFEPAV